MPMTYNEFRETAQDGDLLFLHLDPHNYHSRITAFWTGSLLTHAAFVFWYEGRLLVAESTTHGGSRIALASEYRTRTIETIRAPKPWDTIVDNALARSGHSTYGWFSATYIGLRDWLRTHADIKLPVIKGNKNKACSEYVAEVLGLSDADITPQRLWETLNVG